MRERAILRKLASAGGEIAEAAYHPLGRNVREILDQAETKVFEIAEHGARGQQGFQELRPLLTQAVERIEVLFNRDNPSDVTGVPTGFTDLDHMTSGLQEGDVIHALNRTSIRSVDELRNAFNRLKPGDPAALLVERNGKLTFLTFEME